MLGWIGEYWAYILLILFACYALRPIFNNLRQHSRTRHSAALNEFVFLWCVSSLPIIIAVLMSDAAVVDGEFSSNGFLNTIYSHFPLEAQFVYAASYLAPVLFVAYDILRNSWREDDKRYATQEIKKLMKGYSGVTVWAVVILLLTALAFAQVGGDERTNLMSYWLGSAPALIYLFSLVLWYCSILKGITPEVQSPQSFSKDEEAKKKSFKDRMAAKQNSGAN